MKTLHAAILCTTAFLSVACAEDIKRKFVATDESGKQLLYVDETDPTNDWTVPLPGNRDIHLSKEGSVLVSVPNGYREYSIDGGKLIKEVTTDIRVKSLVRLDNGHTLLAGDNGIVILDENDSKIAFQPHKLGGFFRLLRLTSEGNYLYTSSSTGISEMTPEGKIVRTLDLSNLTPESKKPYFIEELPGGNFLIATGYGATIIIVDKDWNLVRSYGGKNSNKDIPFHFFADAQMLSNGNIVLAQWSGHKRQDSTKAPQLIEFDKDGKIVWSWHDPQRAGCLHGLVVIENEATQQDTQGHRMLIGGCNLGRILLLERDNTVAWEIADPREASDVWMLANSNIIHSTKHGFQEIKPDYKSGNGGEVIWEVKAPEGYECHACQPIGDDRYLVGYSSKTRSYIAEADSKGKEYKTIEIEGQTGKHSSFRQVRKTKEGTYITSQQKNGGKAREYSADGRLIRTFPSGRFSAIRLKNGNTLLGCGDEHRIIEVDPENKIVWELKQGDLPGVKLGFIAGMHLRDNGNILFTNWGGHGGSTGGAILEVTQDKKLVFSTGHAVKNRASSIFVIEE